MNRGWEKYAYLIFLNLARLNALIQRVSGFVAKLLELLALEVAEDGEEVVSCGCGFH